MQVVEAISRNGVCVLMSHSLALRAVAVHAVLYRLVAGLADGPTWHLHGQTRLCAPLDASLQLPALCVHCREKKKQKNIQIHSAATETQIFIHQRLKANCCQCRICCLS